MSMAATADGGRFAWTDEAIGTLRRLARERRSATAIADVLGARRAAVVGKAYRLGITFHSRESEDKWSVERVERLKVLVADGKSASEIADGLAISRCAVISKVHRLGINLARGKGGGQRQAEAAVETPKVKPKPQAKRSLPAPAPALPPRIAVAPPKPVEPTASGWPKPAGPEAVELLATGMTRCKMPLWGHRQLQGLVCGKPVVEGKTYCPGCCKIAYTTPRDRKREWVAHRAAYATLKRVSKYSEAFQQ